MTQAGCELCEQPGGEVVFENPLLRVVLVDDANYPGFCRVILNRHAAEMTDLDPAEREQIMRVVWQVESAVRAELLPDKINLASLGNMVPHVHWHIIPRFADDLHFPNPIWGAEKRCADPASLSSRIHLVPSLVARLRSLQV